MSTPPAAVHAIKAGPLEIAYLEYGPASGWPCILGHGFPYDVHAYDQAAPILAQAGARVIVPYLRGFGPTRFLSAGTPRSGEQAALGVDLLDFMDALKIERAVLGGYDWGGRAACIVAALLPKPGRRARLRQFVQYPEHRACDGAREPRPRRRRSGISTTSTASVAGAA